MSLANSVKRHFAVFVLSGYANGPERFERFVDRGIQRIVLLLPADEALRMLFRLDERLRYHLNRQAIRYEGGVLHPKHRLMHYHDFFVDRVHQDEVVLDIGCGIGAVAHDVAERSGAHVTGIDLDPSHIAVAREHYAHSRVEYIAGDALQDLPNQPVDVVILSNVLEHIDHRPAFLRRICCAVHPSRILIRVPTFERHWHVPLKRDLGMSYFSDNTHFTEYTQEGFAREMTDASLVVTHLEIRWGEIWAEAVPVGGSSVSVDRIAAAASSEEVLAS